MHASLSESYKQQLVRFEARVRELAQRLSSLPVACEYTDTFLPPEVIFTHRVLYVWTGASSSTIYPTPQHNWLFRAHHDMVHRATKLGFTFREEVEAAKIGILVLGLQCSPALADIYWADTVGQQEYYYRHGQFPNDQREFVLRYIRKGGDQRDYGL